MKIICVLAILFAQSSAWDTRDFNEVDSVNEKLMKCCRIPKIIQKGEEAGNEFHTIRIVVNGYPIYGYGKEYATPKSNRKQTFRSKKQLLFYPRIKPSPSRTYTSHIPWNPSISRPPFPLWEPLPGKLPPGPPRPYLAGISRKFRRNLRIFPKGDYSLGRSEGSMASPSENVGPNDVSQNQQDTIQSASALSLRNFPITGIVDRDHISTLVSSSILVRGH